MNCRTNPDAVVYGVVTDRGLNVRVWKQTSVQCATTLPRVTHCGAGWMPYSCETGHVSSWVLWYDLLADALQDVGRAGRLAGLMEWDMSRELRERGRLTFTLAQVIAWARQAEQLVLSGVA